MREKLLVKYTSVCSAAGLCMIIAGETEYYEASLAFQ